MKKRKTELLGAGLSLFLVLALLVGLFVSAGMMNRTEPEDPTETAQPDKITVEAVTARLEPTEDDEPNENEDEPEKPEESPEPSPEPSEEPSPEPSEKPSPSPDDEPDPSSQPSAEPSPAPTGDPNPGPSGDPVPDPSGDPVPDPSGDPKPDPSGDPSPNPSDDPKPSPSGDPSPEPSGDPEPSPSPEEPEFAVVTDLSTRIVARSELRNDILKFYAYITGGEDDMYLRVNFRSAATTGNGVFLTADGRDYQAELTLGKNYFTVYVKQGGSTVYQAQFTITYTADKATEEDPEVGDEPPTISTTLESWPAVQESRDPTFSVTARTFSGGIIYSDHILVTMDGTVLTNPTGTSVFEYQVHFDPPNVGEYEDHKITITAWDDKGNSAFKSYTVRFHFIDEGDKIGTVTVVLDATTLGLGWLDDPYTYTLKQGEPASCAVLAMLEENGYTASYSGTAELGFYLKAISRGDAAYGASVPAELWSKIQADGLTLTGQKSRDSISEFDYTEGSGWMYSINSGYPGRGLSGYFPSDGDTIYVRFTLAYGKDIGGYASSGGSYGVLSSYCGTWINGTYSESHSYGGGTEHEATCTEGGYIEYTCTVSGCGHTRREDVSEPLGHDFVETARVEPTETEDGYVEYTCSRCGETYRDVLPTTGAPSPSPSEPGDEEEPEEE